MSDVEIGWLSAADDDTCTEIHRVVAAVAALGGAVGWLAVPDLAEIRRWIDALLRRVAAGDVRLAVARIDDRIEGLGYWERRPPLVWRHVAQISKVMTHPEARGRGVARAVTAALLADAAAAGFEQTVLNVRGNNHGAVALYESLGFEAFGRLPDGIAVGDERFDLLFMRCVLQRDQGLTRHGGRATGPGASAGRRA